jgi:hypothetical protein
MAYIKTTWENEPSESTPINAENLNKMEDGIYNNSQNIGDITALNTTDKSSVVNAINENTENISGFGKLLWEGSFTSGSITIDGLSDYTTIIVIVGGATCIGSLEYGMGGAGGYGSYTTSIYNYRFGVSGNTLTIDNINRGGSNGTSNVAVTKIYGLF